MTAKWFCRLWWALSVIVLSGTVSWGSGLELPEPPEGYSWKQITKLKAAFLVPDEWEFDSEISKGQYRYTMIRKKQDGWQSGETGLTIVVRCKKDGSDQQNLAPSRFADALVSEIIKYRELERAQASTQGPFATIRYQYVSPPDAPVQSREYSLLVANDKTGTLYILTFQAPLASWDDDWQTVSVVLDTIFLDDEI